MTVSSPAAFRFRVQHHKSLATKDLRIKNVVEYSIVFPQFPTQSILSVYSEDEYYKKKKFFLIRKEVLY